MGEPESVRPTSSKRPSTSGVHVTDHPPGKTNPSPVSVDETELLIEEFLSPRKLVSENLAEIPQTGRILLC